MGMLKLQVGRESEVHDSSMVSNVSCLLISNIFIFLLEFLLLWKHTTKNNLGRKGCISSYKCQVIIHHWGKSGQNLSWELKQSSQRNAANWLAPLIAPTTTNPGVALLIVSWALSYQSSSKTWDLTIKSKSAELTFSSYNQLDKKKKTHKIPFRMHSPLRHVCILLKDRLLQMHPHVINTIL